MKKPGLVARRLPGSVTAVRRPNIPKYLKYKRGSRYCQVKKTFFLIAIPYSCRVSDNRGRKSNLKEYEKEYEKKEVKNR
jgi:hypothetical protein